MKAQRTGVKVELPSTAAAAMAVASQEFSEWTGEHDRCQEAT